MAAAPPFMTIRTRRPNNDGSSMSSADSTYGSASDSIVPATHDISRVSYHVRHLDNFVQTLQESANRAFPNRGRSSQRYSKVQALMLHWKCDDLFVLPELEDLEKCLREDYNFDTDIFPIPSENSHLELMLKIGDMIKKHESEDTLFIIYYGGHARIDESRQSTWCATRHPASPWLQWSAIQTLLERSASDVLILLDCCAGAASATFPNGQSITETISASSWDAIAPDPGRYSFTNALIEVLQEWRHRIFSAAMIHAEVLARLKHPRPILINGKHFEARSTPVHFMMTSNHKAPSIELARIVPEKRLPPTPPRELPYTRTPTPESGGRALNIPAVVGGRDAPPPQSHHLTAPRSPIPDVTDPNENEPHVMISLALEDDQRLDLSAWEQWLANFPALAKYVKVQGVFKSHSTLLLLSLPVMVWDLLPDDPACSFIAFIRSNNLMNSQEASRATVAQSVRVADEVTEPELPRAGADTESFFSGTTFTPAEDGSIISGGLGAQIRPSLMHHSSTTQLRTFGGDRRLTSQPGGALSGSRPTAPPPVRNIPPRTFGPSFHGGGGPAGAPLRTVSSAVSLGALNRQGAGLPSLPSVVDDSEPTLGKAIAQTMILNQSRSSKKTTIIDDQNLPERPPLAKHVIKRLEEYFLRDPEPSVAVTEFFASNLGVETTDIHLWFHHRRQQERMKANLQNLKIDDSVPEIKDGARMMLPGDLNALLEIFPTKSVLLIDLRSSTDFEKSHIHDAINFRAPVNFVQNMALEAIQDTLVDDQSRRSFNKWFQSRCVVFYDRAVEYSWECPVADALYEKFRRRGWLGQCFILKGHYREFSASFDKYISGSKMTGEAKKYLDSLRQISTPTQKESDERHQRYDRWLQELGSQDRAPAVESKKAERIQAVEQHQRELEAEFEARFPALHKKAMSLRPPQPSYPYHHRPATAYGPGGSTRTAWGDGSKKVDDFDATKAAFVEPLASGLEKMREAAAAEPSKSAMAGGGGYLYRSDDKYGSSASASAGAAVDKLGDRIDKLGDRYSDDYDEIDPRREGLKNDPAFQQAGAGKGYGRGGGSSSSAAAPGGLVVDDMQKRRRRPLWGRLRSTGQK